MGKKQDAEVEAEAPKAKVAKAITVKITDAEGDVKVRSFNTCASALTLLEKTGVKFPRKGGTQFKVGKLVVDVTMDVNEMLATGTGRAFAKARGIEVKAAA